MNKTSFKPGSALLIVLGMVAFMVVSAVSFSIFMRQSRLPSSHLRRQVSSRYLLKSALANAISRIDGQYISRQTVFNDSSEPSGSGFVEGVYDNPYPGLFAVADGGASVPVRENGDYWSTGRVFMPFGPLDYAETDDEDEDDDEDPENFNNTVSTLTLEALAYLPPAIINEVRIDSRRTRTARWSNLSYELGRYAFTAVNVSDCFDINRLAASLRRTSAPGERIRMSSLFTYNGEVDVGKAESFDSVLDRCGDIPFVSLADFNIVAGQESFAPFMKYVGSQNAPIYGAGDAASVSNALFITDTWFPENNAASGNTSAGNQNAGSQQQTAAQRVDLAAGGDSQPFKDFSEKKTLLGFASESPTPIRTKLQEILGFVGTACLYDYLDGDSVPLSLCIPSAEAVPMVSSLVLANPFNLKIEKEERNGIEIVSPATEESPEVKFIRNATKYKLTGISDASSIFVSGTVLYPFLRSQTKRYPKNFKAETLIKIWWAPKGINSRLDAGSKFYPDTKEKWASSVIDGVVTLYSQSDLNISPKDNPINTQDAVFDFSCSVNLPSIDLPLMWYVEEWTQKGEEATRIDEKKYYSLNDCHNDRSFRPYAAGGQVDAWWSPDDPKMTQAFPTFDSGKWSSRDPAPHNATALPENEYVLHAAVWIRVVDGDGNTVDMVPARPSDDSLWIAQSAGEDMSIFEKVTGGGSPILEFRGTVPVKYTKEVCEGFSSGTPEPMEWNSLFCCDPRFNWAPENWYKTQGQLNESSLKNVWISQVDPILGSGSGEGRKDDDVFMAVSDQEYLQSIGELGFISDLGWRIGKANKLADYEDSFNGSSMSSRSGAGDCVCNKYFWRTYSADEDPVYDFEGEMEVVSGVNDFRVNPFSDDIRVMTAAIANTPYDYYFASTNNDTQINIFANDDLESSFKHAFCEKGVCGTWDVKDVESIAASMTNMFRTAAMNGKSWQEAFDEMPWFTSNNDEQNVFFGVELEKPLWSVERKFLYSYWRECFQNRQQLFLIFLRAEPLSVGGASGDAIGNAQLGARGVALVWRDPAKPEGSRRPRRAALSSPNAWRAESSNSSIKPHRTRVLFFHQFD